MSFPVLKMLQNNRYRVDVIPSLKNITGLCGILH
jgi:hypothetical protein